MDNQNVVNVEVNKKGGDVQLDFEIINLLTLKKLFEENEEKRKALQKKLLSDPEYLNLLEQEKQFGEAYESLRQIVQEAGKIQDKNGAIECPLGKVAFSYKQAFKIKDDMKLLQYCQNKNVVQNLFRLEPKKKEVEEYIKTEMINGADIDFAEYTKDVSITVTLKK